MSVYIHSVNPLEDDLSQEGGVVALFHKHGDEFSRQQEAIIRSFDLENPDAFRFVFVDCDMFPDAAKVLGIKQIPTILFINGKKEKCRITGFQPTDKLEDLITEYINK